MTHRFTPSAAKDFADLAAIIKARIYLDHLRDEVLSISRTIEVSRGCIEESRQAMAKIERMERDGGSNSD
jgi:hypothetical protein